MRMTFFACICLILGACSDADVNYNVKLNTQTKADIFYLINAENSEVLDSAIQSNGCFTFAGKIHTSSPCVAVVSSNKDVNNYYCSFILDSTPLTINIKEDGQITGDGSAENVHYLQEYSKLNIISQTLFDFQRRYMMLQDKYNGEIPQEAVTQLRDEYNSTADSYYKTIILILNENKDNLVPIMILCQQYDDLDTDFLLEYMESYKYKDRECLEEVRNYILLSDNKAVGARVQDLAMPSLAGNVVNLTDYVGKGNYVLLDFWASWCGPCRAEMPNLKKVYSKYHSKGFEIVGVSLDNNHDAWKKAVVDLDITWPQMSDLKGWKSIGAIIYGINSIPATILFSPDGIVIETNLRGSALEDKLIEIYGK